MSETDMIAIVIASAIAYVAIAGRVYRYINEHENGAQLHDEGVDGPVSVFWPIAGIAIILVAILRPTLRWTLHPVWNIGARRRSNLPKASVRK